MGLRQEVVRDAEGINERIIWSIISSLAISSSGRLMIAQSLIYRRLYYVLKLPLGAMHSDRIRRRRWIRQNAQLFYSILQNGGRSNASSSFIQLHIGSIEILNIQLKAQEIISIKRWILLRSSKRIFTQII